MSRRSAMSGCGQGGGILVMDDINWPTLQTAHEHVKSTFSVIDEAFESDGAAACGAYRHGVAA